MTGAIRLDRWCNCDVPVRPMREVLGASPQTWQAAVVAHQIQS
jgi:hypothetical protein